MDLWGRARGLAEEAARRSQELTAEAARRSQDLRRLSTGFVSDTAKRSLDLAAQASRAANLPDLAGQIKSLAVSAAVAAGEDGAPAAPDPAELARFGVTEELREFVREITIDTFKDFPMADEPDTAPVPAISNVRQDLTQWQARHATLVLSTVKEISKLRYELCPRHMKERRFWRIYFILVDSHVAPHELRYNEEEAQSKAAKDKKTNENSEGPPIGLSAKPVTTDIDEKTKTSKSSAEQDLDVFLLGDMGSSDEGPDVADDADFDDDFDKIVSSSLGSSPETLLHGRRRRRSCYRMEERQRSMLLEAASRFPPPPGMILAYGTSGFRADASVLSSTVFRMGILAALRSVSTGSAIGLMITASHNQVSDNGVKIADPSGGMMTQDWEPFANEIANAVNAQALVEIITQFMKHEGFMLGGQTAEVLLGRDTRPSGEALLTAAKLGISAIVDAVSVDMGVLTTPQLHWMVRQKNKGLEFSEGEYFSQLSHSFRSMVKLVSTDRSPDVGDNKVIVDGANGIGGEKLEELKKLLEGLIIEVRNTGKGEGVLNEGVGADFVQKERIAPSGFDLSDVGKRCASLDGDADRIVYFHVLNTPNKRIALVDGDKILALFALYIKEQLDILGETDVRLGIIQTAYANGASTDFFKQNGLEVIITPTGVKYLHEKAAEYDIGIYFEANGHGTILFSESFLKCLEERNSKTLSESSVKQKAAQRLLAASKIVNEAVGDALSGLLLAESILQHWGWSINEWSSLYNDLPSSQLKVKVADKNAILTTNAETRVANPSGLQDAIDSEVAKYSRGRSFIRPSGTEDIVRIYAEASSQEAADNLAFSVAKHVELFLQ